MSGGNDGWLRTSSARALTLAALAMSLLLGIGFVVINTSQPAEVGTPGNAVPLTDEHARGQVVDSARQIVTAARLQGATGGHIFLSCTNEHDPPYQAAVYLNFRMSETNAVKRIGEIAAAMVAHGWHEAPSMGEHFGKKLTKDGVTSTVHQNLDDAKFGTMRIYGECRNMADHRNDNPAWTDITDQLR
jgi:hypothetical protein